MIFSGPPTPTNPSGILRNVQFRFNEWLIRYMWSVVFSGPAMRSTLQGKLESVTLNGVSQIISNSGRMYGTLRSVSAPASRKTRTRFPPSIRSPSVGHYHASVS